MLKKALLIISFMSMLGCVSVFDPYTGNPVSENNTIPLKKGGPHEGSWETKQMGFSYSYTLASNTLTISGELSCYEASFWTLEIVDSVFFRISFIDSDANLIENRHLWSRGIDNFIYKWRIPERSLTLPPNTVAIGFSYSGSVREAGGTTPNNGGEGIQVDLWYSPLGE